MNQNSDGSAFHVQFAINEITGDLSKEGISKQRKNKEQGYAFRGVDDVYSALSPLLAKHKLNIIPQVKEYIVKEKQTKSGSIMYVTVLRVDWLLVSAVDGSSVVATTYGEAMDSADKSTNKALSAAYKYMCFIMFCIPVEGEENDADASTPEATIPKASVPEKIAPVVRKAPPAYITAALKIFPAFKAASNAGDKETFHLLWTENEAVLEQLRTDENAFIKNAEGKRVHIYNEFRHLADVFSEGA